MITNKISIEQAKKDKLFYVVVNVAAVRMGDMRCLILKQSEKEKVHPGKFCLPGGKLEHENLDLAHPTSIDGDVANFGNALGELAFREMKEEAGISIKKDLRYIGTNTFVRPDGVPVVLLKFAAEYESGEVILERDSFTDFAWVDREEIKAYPCIKGIPDEVKKAIELFKAK